MKTNNKKWKEEVKTFGRQIDSIISYKDGTSIDKDNILSINLHYEGDILKSVMKCLDIESTIEIPINSEINYKFGVLVDNSYEYVNLGNYIVYSSEIQEDKKNYKIICYDKMLYSMKVNEDLGITYPISVRDYINALCNKLGLEFKNKDEEFANYNRMIQKELYVGLDYTYRDIFDELAQVTASTICLDNDDKVEIRYINDLIELNNIKGNPITITDAETYQLSSLTLDGKCEQETTTGKNLIPYPYYEMNKTKSGITWAANEDGSITINGTATELATFWLTNNSKWEYDIETQPYFPEGTYTLNYEGNANIKFLTTFFGENGNNEDIKIRKPGSQTITLTENSTAIIRLDVDEGQTLDNVTIYPMIEKGDSATDFEKYTGGIPSPNPDYPQEIETITGDVEVQTRNKNLFRSNTTSLSSNGITSTYADKNSNEVTTAGTFTNTWANISQQYNINLDLGKYTFSISEPQPFDIKLKIKRSTGSYIEFKIPKGDTSITFDLLYEIQSLYVYLLSSIGAEISSTFKIQLEEGDKTTEFVKFERNIATINLGEEFIGKLNDTYKDELVIENGKAKLIKRIGKVFFDGSDDEEWTISSETKKEYSILKSKIPNSNIPAQSLNMICNYFKVTTNISKKGYFRSGAGYLNFQYDDLEGGLENFKNWLSQYNVEVYYALAEPYEVDLGSVNELYSYEGATYITNNVDGEMSVEYVNNWETIDEEYLKNVNVSFGEKYGKINSIVLSRSVELDNIYKRDEESIEKNGLCELKITDNQIMNWEDREDYLNDIFKQLNGLEYYINDFSSTGIVYLDLCDKYNVSVFGKKYKCVMFNDDIKVTSGLEEIIYTEKPKETETEYTKADTTDRKIKSAMIEINKQNSEIVLKVTDDGKIASVALKGNASDGSIIDIDASQINLTADDILNLIAGNEINLTSKSITIKSDNFNVDSEGNVIFKNGQANNLTINDGNIDLISIGQNSKLKITDSEFSSCYFQLSARAMKWIGTDGGQIVMFNTMTSPVVGVSDTSGNTTNINALYVDTPKLKAKNIQTGKCTLTSSSETYVEFDDEFESVPSVTITPYTLTAGVISPKIRSISTLGFYAIIGGSISGNIDCTWIAIK